MKGKTYPLDAEDAKKKGKIFLLLILKLFLCVLGGFAVMFWFYPHRSNERKEKSRGRHAHRRAPTCLDNSILIRPIGGGAGNFAVLHFHIPAVAGGQRRKSLQLASGLLI